MKIGPIGGAFAVVALVAGGGWVATLSHRHTAANISRQPSPTPTVAVAESTPTESPTAVPPPADIELLWRAGDQRPARIVALDWSGNVRGSLVLPGPTYASDLHPSRDGQRLLVRQGGYAVL